MGRSILARQEPLVTIDDFADTYRMGAKAYQCKRAMTFLEGQGDLPFTYMGPHFTDVNILAAWLFWSGSISSYKAGIDAEPELQEGITETAERLSIGTRPVGENTVFLAKNGPSYARLMVELGIPNGSGTRENRDTKVKMDIEIPPYITYLMDRYIHFGKADRRVATKTLADQCKVLLWSRLTWYSKTHAILRPMENRKRAVAKRLGEQVLRMFSIVYPQMGLDEDSLRMRKNSGGNYVALITLNQDNIFRAIGSYGLFDINPNHSYHTQGRPVKYKGKP